MALISCPECGKKVSDLAPMCPDCGYPIAAMKKSNQDNSKPITLNYKYNYVKCKSSEYEFKRGTFKYSGNAKEIIIPDEITAISAPSFKGKGVKAVLLGKSVQSVGIVNVEWFDVVEDNPFFSSEEGVLFNKDKTEIVRYPSRGAKKEYEIPSYVKRVKNGAFRDAAKLETVVLHDDLNVEESAFWGAKKLETIKWANNAIPDNSWPSGLCLNERVFRGTGIKKFALPNDLVELTSAFENCPIESIVIPQTVKKISDEAFCGCINLKEITIPDSVESIGKNCFQFCRSLEKVVLPDGLDTIPTLCFHGCENLNSVSIPKTVKTIGEYAFSGCYKIKEIDLPEGLECIGNDALPGLAKINRVPDSVKEYGTLFENIKDVNIYDKVWNNMPEEIRQKKVAYDNEREKEKAEDAAREARWKKLMADLNKDIEDLKNGEFFAYQKNARRIVKKREENKQRLNSLLSAHSFTAYNNLLLETNEINKTPIYVYNECGKTVKIYNRNGVDTTFAIEVDGLVYAINPTEDEMSNVVANSDTDASQLDKGIMLGFAGAPLLGYFATSAAQIYNVIDVNFSFVNKKTGRIIKVVLGDRYKINSKMFNDVMAKIKGCFDVLARMSQNVPEEELATAGYINSSLDEILKNI